MPRMGLLAPPDAAVCDWGRRLGVDSQELLHQFRELSAVVAHNEAERRKNPITGFSRPFLSDQVVQVLDDVLG